MQDFKRKVNLRANPHNTVYNPRLIPPELEASQYVGLKDNH
jgi:hypothetical protein